MTRERIQSDLEREVNSWFKDEENGEPESESEGDELDDMNREITAAADAIEENEGDGETEISDSETEIEEENENEGDEEVENEGFEIEDDFEAQSAHDFNSSLNEEELAALALAGETVTLNCNLYELISETYRNLESRSLTAAELNKLDRDTIFQAGMISRNFHGFLGVFNGYLPEVIFEAADNNPIHSLLRMYNNILSIQSRGNEEELEIAGRSLLTLEEIQQALTLLIKSGVNPDGLSRDGSTHHEIPLLLLDDADVGLFNLIDCFVENGANLNLVKHDTEVFSSIINMLPERMWLNFALQDRIKMSMITKSHYPITNINILPDSFFTAQKTVFIKLSNEEFTFFKNNQYNNLSNGKQDFIDNIEVYRDKLYNSARVFEKSNLEVTSDNHDRMNPFLTIEDKANLLAVAKQPEQKQSAVSHSSSVSNQIFHNFANENKSELAVNSTQTNKNGRDDELEQNLNKKSKTTPSTSPALVVHISTDIEMQQRVAQSRTGAVSGVQLASRNVNNGAGLSNG